LPIDLPEELPPLAGPGGSARLPDEPARLPDLGYEDARKRGVKRGIAKLVRQQGPEFAVETE
jgi:hypothetical protein